MALCALQVYNAVWQHMGVWCLLQMQPALLGFSSHRKDDNTTVVEDGLTQNMLWPLMLTETNCIGAHEVGPYKCSIAGVPQLQRMPCMLVGLQTRHEAYEGMREHLQEPAMLLHIRHLPMQQCLCSAISLFAEPSCLSQ